MKTKQEIVENWLPRYTGLPLEKFGKYILLTNFQNYVDRFAEWQAVEVVGRDKSMPCATDGEITIINFSMGSATQPKSWSTETTFGHPLETSS